jgi:FMN-dependent NADH-azoreductase
MTARSILYLRCSPRGAAAFSSRMAEEVVARLRALHPAADLVFRDLAASPPPLVDAAFSAAILSSPPGSPLSPPPLGRPDAPAPALAASEALIEELAAADVLVVATPMHNYGVPAVLKAWVDQIVRIHRTFASTPAGKVGTLPDRPVWLVVASGGWFTGPSPSGAPAQPDFLTPYLRAVLATIGIRDLHILTLEGVTRGADIAEAAFTQARAALDRTLPVP